MFSHLEIAIASPSYITSFIMFNFVEIIISAAKSISSFAMAAMLQISRGDFTTIISLMKILTGSAVVAARRLLVAFSGYNGWIQQMIQEPSLVSDNKIQQLETTNNPDEPKSSTIKTNEDVVKVATLIETENLKEVDFLSVTIRHTVYHNQAVLVFKEGRGLLTDCNSSDSENDDEVVCNFQELKRLLEQIHHSLNGQVCGEELECFFSKVVKLLEESIHVHGATFTSCDEQQLCLRVGNSVIVFNKQLQNAFSVLCNARQNKELVNPIGREYPCIIYRIGCKHCVGYCYVGQAVQTLIDSRIKERSLIKRKKSLLLASHAREKHPGIKAVDLYEMSLLHALPDNASSPRDKSLKAERDKRIRRDWEMFYQWAHKSKDFHGGANY